MRDYYASRAPEYDKVYLKPERQTDLREIERWLPTVFTGLSILEVACGTGYWTQFLAPVATHILAIDAAPETIEIAKDRISPGKIEFVVGDAYALPRVTRPYQAGFAGFWISHVPKLRVREFLTGFHRALAPGARVVLLDNRFVVKSSTPIAEQDAEGNAYQVRQLGDGTKHRVLKNFPSHDELREATAGLATKLHFHEWEYFWALEYVAEVP